MVDRKEEKGNSSMDEDDVTLLARKFSKFLSRSKRNKRKGLATQKGIKKDRKKSNNEIIRYECKKSRHIRQDCPLRKKKRDKKEKRYMKKAFPAT